MKRIFLYGLTASLMVAFVFAGCKKDDEEIAPYFDMSSKRLLSKTTSNGDGNDYKTEYKYDEQGNVIEIRHLVGGRVTNKCKMWYNEYGDVVKKLSSDDNVLTDDNDWTIYEYDYNGNVVTITESDDRYTQVYVDTYADSERKQLLSHSTSNNTIEYYTYDNEGNLIKLEEYNGELIYRREITVYDENTVYFSKYYYYDYSTSIDSTHIKYVYTDSKREHIVSYEYNNDGNNRAEYTSYDSNGNISLVEIYLQGKLVAKQTDYEYKNNTVMYYYCMVNENGEIKSKTHYVLVYSD